MTTAPVSPLVSLLITNRNRDRYLATAIKSVLAQTFTDFELIIWDDGSTDRSVEIAQQFAAQDQRIRVIAAPHQGIPRSRTAAIAQLTGRYLGWVDSDDILAPTALAETVAVLESHPRVGMVYTDYLVMDAESQVTGLGSRCQIPYSREALLHKFITFHFRLLRRSVYDQIGGIHLAFPYAYDYDLCLRLSEVTDVYPLKKPLYFYRYYAANNSHRKAAEQTHWAFCAVEQALNRRQRLIVDRVNQPARLRRRALPVAASAVAAIALPWLGWATPTWGNTLNPVGLTSDTNLIAQSITPAADGTGTIVSPSGSQYQITGGSSSSDGANLFHSFDRFGLESNESANFIAPPETMNVLGRIMGGDASVINGLLQLTGSNANLYLINPSGILFGANARLDLPGSLTVSTADGLRFGNGWWNAIGTNDYSSLVGEPNGYRFTVAEPGAIANLGNLTVTNGSLTLLGGSVVSTGKLSAPNGALTVAAVPGESLVQISQPGNLLSLEVQPLTSSPSADNTWTLPVLSLPELLTGQFADADQIQITSEGQVVLAASGSSVNAGDVMVQSANSDRALFSAQQSLFLPESTVVTTGNLTLQAGDTVQIRDTVDNPVLLSAGNDLTVQGNQQIDIFALNHDQSGLVAGNDLTLRSANTVGGDAHYWSGGNFQIETLDGSEGSWFSPYDPVVRSAGNVSFDSYTGASLHIFAGGSVTVTGNITINAPDAVDSITENNIGLSNGTAINIDGASVPTLDIRAGTTAIGGAPLIPPPGSGFTPGNPVLTAAPTAANITIGGNIQVAPFSPNNLTEVFLTTQYAPNAVAGGNITVGGTIDTSSPFGGYGGDVVVDARGNVDIGGTILTGTDSEFGPDTSGDVTILAPSGAIEVAAIDTSSLNAYGGEGGDVTLQASGDITANGAITTLVVSDPQIDFGIFSQGGEIQIISSAGSVTVGDLDTSAEMNPGFVPGVESTLNAIAGDITVQAGQSITAANVIATATTPASTAQAGEVQLIAGATPGQSNIQFTRIDTSASSLAGPGIANNVTVTASDGTVQGTGQDLLGRTINAEGSTAGGTVAITHDGGPDNVPFTVGDASTNGTAGDIVTNADAIAPLATFPNAGTETATNGTISITFNNIAPNLSTTTNSLSSPTNAPILFTIASFTPATGDSNADNLTYQIDSILDGELFRADGVTPVLAGDTVTESETLIYVPAGTATTAIDAFTLVVNDGLADSAAVTITFQTGEIPEPNPNPNPNPNPEPKPEPEDITFQDPVCPPFCGGEPPLDVDENPSGGEVLPPITIDEAQAVLQDIADKTGIEPALIYVNYLPATLAVNPGFSELEATASQEIANYLNRSDQSRGIAFDLAPQPTDELELLLVTANQPPVRRRVPGITRQQVEAAAVDLQTQLTDPRLIQSTAYRQSAQQLYQWIIGTLQADLVAQEVENIAFIMPSKLRSLPVAALYDGQQFLIEQYSLGLMPSLNLIDTRYEDVRNSQVLAMGTDKFKDLPALPAVPVELAAIGDTWTGETLVDEAFTIDNLKKERQITPFGIIHIASHAEFLPGDPSNSFIQFNDQRLKLSELRELGLNEPPVELLVLSACRTAIGNEDAELGFAGLALQAGVKSALASLWYVSDEGTLALMTEFYNQLQTSPIKAEALRQTQIAMLQGQVQIDERTIEEAQEFGFSPPLDRQEGQESVGNSDLSHPFYWSAFTLVGSPW
ncbi:MAG: CHAT domain-containing protein [Thainema sp.]